MVVLIIGSGGREHALADIYSKSKGVKEVFVAPGNDFMTYNNEKIKTLPHIPVTDIEEIVQGIKDNKIDFVDVAQDEPLALGFVDKLTQKGIAVFGPTKKAAEIEWNKEWSRNFMTKYNLPIPNFQTFHDPKKALKYIDSLKEQPLFIKASGLALGKGAIKAKNKEQTIQAVQSMKQFGKAGETFLIEECLGGEEFSLFALCDGENYNIISTAQDHKTAYEKDRGPNTGGMGCVSPITLLTPSLIQIIEQTILIPFMLGMQQEKRPYKGVLYLGGIITNPPAGGGIKIIEFNARFGDPEAEVILPSIQTDYLSLIQAVQRKKLSKNSLVLDRKIRISIAGCAKGYPLDYSNVKGKKIYGLEEASKQKGISIYGAGIKKRGNYFVVNGGRVFHLVAEGDTIGIAQSRAYQAINMIYIEGNNLYYRKDIGWREIERKIYL